MTRAPVYSEMTALFGGRFDPPHLGHQTAIQGLFKNPGVREVWVLPTPNPAHKPAIASLEHRLEMAKLAFSGESVRVDLTEIERARRSPGPTYSFDTLQEVRRNISKLAFVIGTDQLEALPRWHRFPEILGLCHWIALGRNPEGVEAGRRAMQAWEGSGIAAKAAQSDLWTLSGGTTLLLCPTDAPAVSSTEIRERLSRTGEIPEELLGVRVSRYLKNAKLYGIRGN